MPELSNSQRRLYKATYAPISVERGGRPAVTHRALVKGAFAGALARRPSEIAGVRRRLGSAAEDPSIADALTAVGRSGSGTPAAAYHYAYALTSVPAEALVSVGEALAEERASVAAVVQDAITTMRLRYGNTLQAANGQTNGSGQPPPPPALSMPSGNQLS